MTSPASPVSRAVARRSLPDIDGAASQLKVGALSGTARCALRERHLAILCDDPKRPEVSELQSAAADLGAQVALVSPSLDAAGNVPALENMSRVLGRLYDAVLCVGIPERIVRALQDAAGVPVVGDVTGEWNALLATRPDIGADARYLLQALLVGICA